MTTFRKNFTRILALVLVLAIMLPMAACRRNQDPQETTAPVKPVAPAVTYTVQVQTAGGMDLAGVGVYIYEDETMAELVWFDQTGEDGTMTFTDVPRDTYVAVLSDVPTGYVAEDFYPITGETTTIVLEVGTLDEDSAKDLVYKLGDMMMDFTVTDPDGTTYTLSELLKQKKAVMLNFWYIGCEPCKAEFPFLQEAYEQYSGDVAVLAMNHIDPEGDIAAFRKENGYTFPMVSCDPMWQKLMNLSAYPTTVMIDRFGNICLIHRGTIDNAKTFKDTFSYFASEAYEPKPVKDITELLTEEEEGTEENPMEMGGQATFQIEVEPGKEIFTEVYKAKGMYMSIWGKTKDFYVLYNDKKYTPDNSKSVGFVITTGDNYTPAVFGIGNTGTETQTFNVYLSHLEGTFNNPYKLKEGEFTATVNAGNEKGVYFRGTAPENGTFIVQCISAPAGIKYDFSLQSMDVNWTVLRNYGGDGTVDEKTGYPTVKLPMKKGMDVMFSVGTLPDDSNSYPGGTFKFLLTFVPANAGGSNGEVGSDDSWLDGFGPVKVEKIDYTVTVTDDTGKPLQNISVWLTKDETTHSAKTNEQGIVTLNLEKGEYTCAIGVPEGYTLEKESYTLTPEVPAVTVKLQKVADTRVDYTVKACDPEGNPVAGVEVVLLGIGNALTDAQGLACFKLEPGKYSVLVASVPAGFKCSQILTLTAEQRSGTLELTYVPGTEHNPIALTEYSNKLTNAGTVYYSVQFDGAVMNVTGTGSFTVLLNGNTLNPVEGQVSQLIRTADSSTPVIFAITGNGEFTVNFTYPAGHQMNPAPLTLGTNTAAQAAGASDYYYNWTAIGTGELTIAMDETAQWIYSVSNLTTGVSGELHRSDDETPVPAETLTVSEGDVIQVVVNTYDPADTAKNPAGDVVTEASFVWVLPCENFTTAPVPAGDSWTYRLTAPEGGTLTISNANAYVLCGETTYNPDTEGVITVELGTEETVELTIGNIGADAESFPVSFSWPEGHRRNPKKIEKYNNAIEYANLEEGDADGFYYLIEPTQTGTLKIARMLSNKVDYTITVYRNGDEEILTHDAADKKKTVEVYVFPEDRILIHLQANQKDDGTYPAINNDRVKLTFTVDYTTYTVTFDPNGGTLTGAATMETVNGRLPEMPADPVRQDYKFLGWFDQAAGGKQFATTTNIKANCTVYAQWEKIEYNVTFDALGGVLTGKDTYLTTDYKLSALPQVSKEGYEFLGWFDLPSGGNAVTVDTVYTAHTTVYAQWKSLSTDDTGNKITYQVRVINEKGEPVTSGVYVTWQNSERMETRIINDASGTVSADLPAANYTIMLTMTGTYQGYRYDAASAVTGAANAKVTIRIAKPVSDSTTVTNYGDVSTTEVPLGATYVKLNSSQANYAVVEGKNYCFFQFNVTEQGRYRFSVSNKAPISDWGTNTSFINDQTTAQERQDNAFYISVKESNFPEGSKSLPMIFAVEVTADYTDTIVIVEYVGLPEWSIEDEPYTVFSGTQTPSVALGADGKPVAVAGNVFKLTTGGKSLTYVNMKTDKPVKGDDGFYHLNSKTGPVLYVNLGENAPYISMGLLTGAVGQYGTGFRKIFTNTDGTYVVNPDGTYKKEDYTDAMIAYCLHVDPTTGVYPLTEDLVYMLQQGGEFKGWFDPASDTYLFKEQSVDVDLSLAWMFAVCYLK